MPQVKTQKNSAPVKTVQKKKTRKKPVPGSIEAFEESLKIIKKNNLDFSYLKP